MGELESASSTAKAPGRVSRAITRLFMKRACVSAIDDLADRFRLITLEGDALQGVAWTPGQKVQIAMGSAFVARTYTPIEWDAIAGRTRILGYAHGEGPGSAWILGLEVGNECDLFGPRSSLDVRPLAGPLAVFGDETSIGLASALARQEPAHSVRCYLEIGDGTAIKPVLAALDMEQASVFERAGGDGQLTRMEAALQALVGAGSSFVLTGRAATIQRLRQALKRQGVPSGRIATKAYWAPGKTGLD